MNSIIGQERLTNYLYECINNNDLPRYMIFTGNRGSGRKTIVNWLCNELKTEPINCGVGIDDIRDMIKLAYKRKTKAIYTLFDADNMSVQAKNSLLKVTEEPPNNAYIIMTLEDINNTLDTIKSRATVFSIDRYTPSEIGVYSDDMYKSSNDGTLPLYKDLCDTPGEVDLLYKFNAQDFYDFVKKVIDNIATVSGANVFKIGDKINFKDNDDKYDLKLFWKCFNKVLYDTRTNMSGIVITNKYLKELNVRGINKQMLFDMWILDIRKEWNLYE